MQTAGAGRLATAPATAARASARRREGAIASERKASPTRARRELAERLRERLPEIEAAVLTRVHSVSDPTEVGEAAYVQGLRGAVSAALAHALAGIEAADPEPAPVPAELLSQARAAARAGVSLDTVLRRYVAGHALLADFLIAEAERGEPLPHEQLQRLLAVQAAVLDNLIAEVSEEHGRENCRRERSKERRRAECARRLLDGELADASELAYELGAHHIAALAEGPSTEEALRAIAAGLDRRLLLVCRGEGPLWAWLGGTRPLDPERLQEALESCWPERATLALGEPGEGLSGWRLSHRQAAAALPVARKRRSPVRYGEVALLAAALSDEVLGASLRQLYLAPLEAERDGGQSAKATLRAYFAAERNASSAAAVLRVSRKTVTARLRAIERALGRRLWACAAELDVALNIEAMDAIGVPRLLPPGR